MYEFCLKEVSCTCLKLTQGQVGEKADYIDIRPQN
jgi:hypothetical protein